MEKTLDLTPMMWCQKREELRKRETIAEEYSANVKGKLKRAEVRKMQVKETIIVLLSMSYLIVRILL